MSKILLIEDEDSIRKIMAYDLLKAGYDIDEADNGIDGEKLGLTGNYDLIIIDWMLPKKDGFSVFLANCFIRCI